MQYKIITKENELVRSQGEYVIINEIDCVIEIDIDGYSISHLHTGARMAYSHYSLTEAIDEMVFNVKNKPNWLQEGIKMIRKAGYKYPINEIPQSIIKPLKITVR